MPFVNVKVVKNQMSPKQKKDFIHGLTDLIVNTMGRERSLTVITVDELEASQWAIGGVTLDEKTAWEETALFINMKVSKGTTNPDEINRMMAAVKELTLKISGNSSVTNYFIIDELNPDAWGFGGLSMTERRKLNQ